MLQRRILRLQMIVIVLLTVMRILRWEEIQRRKGSGKEGDMRALMGKGSAYA